MGGKPQKPKIQAYVEQQWFDEFENYRQQHNLNQSKTLEKILSQFFGSEPPTYTAIAPDFTSALEELQEELQQKFSNLSQRLLVVEGRLAGEAVDESAVPLTESVMDLNGLANESASESATGGTGLAAESSVESALSLAESATGLNESANESVVAPHGLASESAQESASGVEAIAPDSIPDEVKRGKRPAEETRKLIESRLAQGKIVDIKKLASLANVSPEAVRQRTRDEKLGEWGIEPIPNTRPQAYRRI